MLNEALSLGYIGLYFWSKLDRPQTIQDAVNTIDCSINTDRKAPLYKITSEYIDIIVVSTLSLYPYLIMSVEQESTLHITKIEIPLHLLNIESLLSLDCY